MKEEREVEGELEEKVGREEKFFNFQEKRSRP